MVDLCAIPLRAIRALAGIAGELRLVSRLTAGIEAMHSELAGLRSELSSMPKDSARLADDVEAVHGTLRAVSCDLTEMKASVVPVHGDLMRVEAGLSPLPDAFDTLLLKVDDLARRLDGMRSDLTDEVDALRTDLSSLPFVTKS